MHSPLKPRCFRCLATDHRVNNCRDPLRCARCGGNGHRSFECIHNLPPFPDAPLPAMDNHTANPDVGAPVAAHAAPT
jgi:hypothetical protein